MTIEKIGVKWYKVSDIVNNQLIKCEYMDYTKKEAVKLFKEKIRGIK